MFDDMFLQIDFLRVQDKKNNIDLLRLQGKRHEKEKYNSWHDT